VCPKVEEKLRSAWREAASKPILRGQRGEKPRPRRRTPDLREGEEEICWFSLYTRQAPILVLLLPKLLEHLVPNCL
jgi:hypothetical protein